MSNAIVSREGVRDAIDKLGRDKDPQTRQGATELVKAARDRGELGQVYAQAEEGKGLELLCDANDHDETSREALAAINPRQLMEHLISMPADCIQWRLAPVRVVIAALFFIDLPTFFPNQEKEDDDLLDEDEEELERANKPNLADDDDESELEEEESATRLFLDEFRKRFHELFERQDGHPPYREDEVEARDVELDGVGVGVLRIFLEGPADLELTRMKIENWIADLLGEEEVQALVPAEPSSTEAPDKFEV